jgi:hypothetical protein
MPAEHEFVHQASILRALLSNADDSDVIAHADELLLFLNRVHDFIKQKPHSKNSFSSVNDIVYRLESDPEATLQDKNVRARLINLFAKLTRLQSSR